MWRSSCAEAATTTNGASHQTSTVVESAAGERLAVPSPNSESLRHGFISPVQVNAGFHLVTACIPDRPVSARHDSCITQGPPLEAEQMKSYKLLMTIGLAAVLGISSLGTAIAGWCWSDPILEISAPGMRPTEISIDAGVDDMDKHDIELVDIVVTVPANVNARVTFMDYKLPEKVTILHSDEQWTAGQTVKVNVNVKVISDRTFETAYTITHTKEDGTKEVFLKTAKTNTWTANEFGLFVRQ
jgi:hypothetical protein